MKEFEIALPVGQPLTQARMASEARRLFGRDDLQCVESRRSIDARGKLVCRHKVEAWFPEDDYRPYRLDEYKDVHDSEPVIVVGAGPAGMFAALRLLMQGLKPVVLERGKDVHARKVDMALLSREGRVNPDSNYCYGEGGAGAFSDGKLFTRSSKRGDIREVLHQLVLFGASPDILVEAHPHIGTDKLPLIVENIRRCVLEHGGEYHFSTRVTDLVAPQYPDGSSTSDIEGSDDGCWTVRTETPEGPVDYVGRAVILATGHSARDIYEMIQSHGWPLEPKGFALGVRVEHPQSLINNARYHGQWRKGMPAAEYAFVEQVDGRGVFSFCMCPGGILVPSSTEDRSVVLNGMSNSARNSYWANAGVVVQIEPEDIPSSYASAGPFAVMDFQQDVERGMYEALHGEGSDPSLHPLAAPAQRMVDFCKGRVSRDLPGTSYHPGAVSAPLHKLLPPMVAERMRKAFPLVDKKIRGYYTNDALLLAVESRTSSPVRIPRDPQSLSCVPGLFPCGEGAGYSGGIVSSAIDGIRCALSASSLLAR